MASPVPDPAPRAPKKPIHRRLLRHAIRLTIAAAVTFVLVVGGGSIWLLWFFPNRWVKNWAEQSAGAYGIAISIGKLDVHLLHGVTLENVTVDVPSNRHAGFDPLLSIGRAHLEWDFSDLWNKRLHLLELELTSPRLRLIQKTEKPGVPPKWNWERAMDDLTAVPVSAATPAPTVVPTSAPIEQQLEDQSKSLDQTLASLPAAIDLDQIRVREAGVDVVTDDGTIATLDHAGFDMTLHLPLGGGATASLDVPKTPGIEIALQPSADLGFSATFSPDAHVSFDLPKSATFHASPKLTQGLLVATGLEIPVSIDAAGKGTIDLSKGDIALALERFNFDQFVDVAATLDVASVGTKGIHAAWSTDLHGDKLPADVAKALVDASAATSLHPGAIIRGKLDGTLDSSDVAVLQNTFSKGRFPLVLTLQNDGVSDDDPIAMKGLRIGKLEHHATLTLTHESLGLQSLAKVSKISVPQAFGGTPFSVKAAEKINVASTLDAIEVGTASIDVPEIGLALEGHGHLAGLNAALAAWQKASATQTDTTKSALGAITLLTDINLNGRFDFVSKKEREMAPGVTMSGEIHSRGSLTRGKDPFGRLTADLRYEDFSAKVLDTTPPVTKPEPKPSSTPPGVKIASAGNETPAASASPTPAPTPVATDTPPLLSIEGLTAHLTIDRELILGGHPVIAPAPIAADDAAIFDPATRGYYDRLGSLRAETDNFHIRRVTAGRIEIRDLSSEILYDGDAIRVNRTRMEIFGGESVARAIIRPTARGVHIAGSMDSAGMDMAPFLLEHPIANASPNDTRVHISTAAAFFLDNDDPLASLADAHAKMDMTCSGSKVIDTVLAYLDPENKDPMYNYARTVNRKVVGLTRPQISSVADRGMYNITIAFPSLGISKDVKRIPLAPLLKLHYTRDMIGPLAPPRWLAARGVDADGNPVLPPVVEHEE